MLDWYGSRVNKPNQSFQQSMLADEILARLFQRHFDDPISALRRFEKLLALAELPFDLKTQLRELILPPQPSVPSPPRFVYYFVPNSKRGTDKVIDAKISDPLHNAYLNKADGIGINLGCPIRLFRALEALEKLPKPDQKSPREGLKNPLEHLTAIEELLWLFGWKSMTGQRRGGQIQGARGDVDWAFEAAGLPVYLEVKFRQSDWMRLSDAESFMMTGDGFLSKAIHKFPNDAMDSGLHIVGITLYHNLTRDILYQIGDELRAAPQIDAVVVRSLIQMTHVISLKLEMRDVVFSVLVQPSNRDFPTAHGVIYDRAEKAERVKLRTKEPPATNSSGVLCWPLEMRKDLPEAPEIEGLYNISIHSRKPDGEPVYHVIPKFLYKK